MGTWRLSNFGPQAARVIWRNENFGWDVVSIDQPTLDNQPPGPPSPNGGELIVRLSSNYASLYLDGSSTPTALEDLPDDFGIDAITYLPRLWMKNGVDTFTANFPVCQDASNPGGGDVFRGAASQYYWTIQPLGLGEYQLTGVADSTILLVDPYLGVGYPPVFTKWNGFLQTLLQQGTFSINFQSMSAQFGAYLMFVFLEFVDAIDSDGYLTIGENWGIEGTYDSYPPPPNPTVYPTGGLDFGDDASLSLLTDASGIYTLTPGLFRDELWQRVGTTATITNFAIPRPFFKTGYIGDK